MANSAVPPSSNPVTSDSHHDERALYAHRTMAREQPGGNTQLHGFRGEGAWHGIIADTQHGLPIDEGHRYASTASGLEFNTPPISDSGTAQNLRTYRCGDVSSGPSSQRQYNVTQHSSPIPQISTPIPSCKADSYQNYALK